MIDTTVKLNNKINTTNRKRYRSMKSIKANKISGISYVDELPNINESTLALVFDKRNNKLFVNGKDRWYSIDRFEGTIPAIKKKHLIFIQRPIMFYSLFYYNEKNEKIYITELNNHDVFNTIFDKDLIIDAITGYNLYASYVEVG